MLRAKIMEVVSVSLAAATVFTYKARAAETDVSPELAKKAAVVFLVNHHGDEVQTGYPVKVSEPKVFFSYDNTRRYYIVYTYVGPGIITTWKELEKDPNGEYEYFRSFLIPADKREMGYLWGHSGIPEPIRSKARAEKIITSKYPGEQVEYVKTVIQGSSIFLTFRVSGKEYFVSPTWGHVHEASTEIGVAPPPDPEKYRALTEQTWAEVDNTDVDEYLLEGTDDSTYEPTGFDAYQYINDTPPNMGLHIVDAATKYIYNYEDIAPVTPASLGRVKALFK